MWTGGEDGQTAADEKKAAIRQSRLAAERLYGEICRQLAATAAGLHYQLPTTLLVLLLACGGQDRRQSEETHTDGATVPGASTAAAAEVSAARNLADIDACCSAS